MRGNGGAAMIRGFGAAMMRGLGAAMILTGGGTCGLGAAMIRTGGGAAASLTSVPASICATIFAGGGASMTGTFGAASFLTLASRDFVGGAPLSQFASKLEPTITTV